MESTCYVCRNESEILYCGHCIASSPDLLLRMRLDLIELRQINNQLKDQVDDILTKSIQRPGNYENDNSYSSILAERLHKLDVLKQKKRNNRIKFRTNSLLQQIDKKKEYINQLKVKLADHDYYADNSVTDNNWKEISEKLTQINSVVQPTQQSEHESLIQWFNLKKRSSYEVPYSLAFLPIVSFRTFHKLPRFILTTSLSKSFQFLRTYTEMMPYQLTYDNDEFNDINELSDDEILLNITKLLVNLVQLGKFKKVLPRGMIDMVWLLDQYDIDALFYNIVTGRKNECKTIKTYWTFDDLLKIVSRALRFSTQSVDALSKQSDLTASEKDMWFVVG